MRKKKDSIYCVYGGCKSLPRLGKTTCEKHAQYFREATRKSNVRRAQSGLCRYCSNLAILGKTRCQNCFDKSAKDNRERKRARKRQSIEYLGGKCLDCGLVSEHISIYDFHHRDPSVKEMAVGWLFHRSWDNIKIELDKCDLLCSNCHRIRHELE